MNELINVTVEEIISSSTLEEKDSYSFLIVSDEHYNLIINSSLIGSEIFKKIKAKSLIIITKKIMIEGSYV